MSQYENLSDKQATEPTWEQSWMHGICVPQWDKPCAGAGTLELIKKTDEENGKRKLSIENSSVSTKKAKTTAIHNQSERKRRDKISQRMKILQEMVPNCSSKTDKASTLDEVIEYVKTLEAQNRMMINMSSMMLPLMQQELQMFMRRMRIRMGMGVMEMNTIECPAMQPVIPSASTFMPNLGDCLPTPPTDSVMSDPLAALLANQSQPITTDSRLVAMFQQLQQAMYQQLQQPSTSKP